MKNSELKRLLKLAYPDYTIRQVLLYFLNNTSHIYYPIIQPDKYVEASIVAKIIDCGSGRSCQTTIQRVTGIALLKYLAKNIDLRVGYSLGKKTSPENTPYTDILISYNTRYEGYLNGKELTPSFYLANLMKEYRSLSRQLMLKYADTLTVDEKETLCQRYSDIQDELSAKFPEAYIALMREEDD